MTGSSIGSCQGLDFKEGSFRPFRSTAAVTKPFSIVTDALAAKAFPRRLIGFWYGLLRSWQGRRPCRMTRAFQVTVNSLKSSISQNCMDLHGATGWPADQDVIDFRRLRWNFPKGGYEAGVGVAAIVRLQRKVFR